MVWLRANFIKCVVLGDDHVGKTSLLMNYATNRFPSQHVPTVFDNYAGSITLSGRHYNLQLIDTLDEGLSPEARRHTYPGTDVFVICFSVVQPQSFTNIVNKWLPEIRRFMGEAIPFILIGTQADLREDDRTVRSLAQKGERPVTTREALLVCRRLGGACYIESSPVMKKRMRRVINDAFVSVFRPKEEESTCTIL